MGALLQRDSAENWLKRAEQSVPLLKEQIASIFLALYDAIFSTMDEYVESAV